LGQHADYFGAADSSIPLALRQLAPEEGSDPVELVGRQRLKKAADIGDRRFIAKRLQHDAQTTQVSGIRGLTEHAAQQGDGIAQPHILRDWGLLVDDLFRRVP
jgi:hypothetical protein